MKLGELEFKAGDFHEAGIYEMGEHCALEIAIVANRLLKERLEKAPLLVSESFHGPWWESAISKHDTHRARLVCIEEVEK